MPKPPKPPDVVESPDLASVVVTFRVQNAITKKVVERLPPIMGNPSHHQLARKILLDFSDGKLVYLNRQHRQAAR